MSNLRIVDKAALTESQESAIAEMSRIRRIAIVHRTNAREDHAINCYGAWLVLDRAYRIAVGMVYGEQCIEAQLYAKHNSEQLSKLQSIWRASWAGYRDAVAALKEMPIRVVGGEA